jgi:hypothetical protein
LTPDQIRTVMLLAGLAPSEAEVEPLARGIARVRVLAASLRALDLDDVPPWPPPS